MRKLTTISPTRATASSATTSENANGTSRSRSTPPNRSTPSEIARPRLMSAPSSAASVPRTSADSPPLEPIPIGAGVEPPALARRMRQGQVDGVLAEGPPHPLLERPGPQKPCDRQPADQDDQARPDQLQLARHPGRAVADRARRRR